MDTPREIHRKFRQEINDLLDKHIEHQDSRLNTFNRTLDTHFENQLKQLDRGFARVREVVKRELKKAAMKSQTTIGGSKNGNTGKND